MVSRKKAKGKARRAAKAEKNNAVEVAYAEQKKQSSLEAQVLERPQIDNMLRAGNDDAAAGCTHGHSPLPRGHDSAEFIDAYVSGFNAACREGKDILDSFDAAIHATKNNAVWHDTSKMEMVITFFLSEGAQQVINGNETACNWAVMASYFEQYAAVTFYKTQAVLNFAKIFELLLGDLHTLVRHLQKRVPCACLDEKYKEVKSVTKVGLCCNRECKLPDRTKVERSKMLYCTRCRAVNYCSPECQKAHWPTHKVDCDLHVDFKAKKKMDSAADGG